MPTLKDFFNLTFFLHFYYCLFECIFLCFLSVIRMIKLVTKAAKATAAIISIKCLILQLLVTLTTFHMSCYTVTEGIIDGAGIFDTHIKMLTIYNFFS